MRVGDRDVDRARLDGDHAAVAGVRVVSPDFADCGKRRALVSRQSALTRGQRMVGRVGYGFLAVVLLVDGQRPPAQGDVRYDAAELVSLHRGERPRGFYLDGYSDGRHG